MRLDVAGEGTLEALIFEWFARRAWNVMGFLRFSPLENVHTCAVVPIRHCSVCQLYLAIEEKKKSLTVLPHTGPDYLLFVWSLV